MKRVITHLLLIIGVASFVSFSNVTRASLGYLSPQDVSGDPSGDNSNGLKLDNEHDLVPWSKRKEQIQGELQSALHRADVAVKKSDDADVQARFKDLSGKINKLIVALQESEKPKDFETKAKELNGSLRTLESDAQKGKMVGTPTPTLSANLNTSSTKQGKNKEGGEDEPSIFTYGNIVSTLSLLLGLISLVAMSFLLFKFRSRLDQLEVTQGKIVQTLNKMKQSIGETKTYAESVGASLSRVQDDLGLKIESAKRSSEEAKKMARSVESAPSLVEPLRVDQQRLEPIDPEPSFPALVSDYLNRIKASRKKGVEADFRTNKLVPTTDGSAPFMFVEDVDGSGSGIVLPKPRLQRSQEFSSYYKGYYYCNEPSAGEVYVVEPAIVERDGNEWRLRHMGRMEIR